MITYVTSNAKKVAQLERYLSVTVNRLALDLPEIQSLDLGDITKEKAREAFRRVNGPVLVEDTALTFLALGKLPGPLVKWFGQELGNAGLCQLLASYSDKRAVADVCYCLFDGKAFHQFSGRQDGTISDTPRGETGFGWNPIFIPVGYDKTWGEMSEEEHFPTSIRRRALADLSRFLETT